MSKQYRHYVGIDTGVNTGFAEWHKENKKLLTVESLPIHKAMDRVKVIASLNAGGVLVRVEDARLRKWFGKAGPEQLQGAGSIKRDAGIWEAFLKDIGVDFEMVPPKNNKTKLDSPAFKKLTGWEKATNNHGRDAAMLVFGF